MYQEMKQKKEFWFTLIEVLVATSILSLSIFGIYKLIGENMRLIGNSSALSTAALLLNNGKECVKSFWYDAFWNSWKYGVDFWNDNLWCFTWSYSSDYSFTWVTIDSKKYYISAEILSTSTGVRDWNFELFQEDIGKKQIHWRQVK